MRPSRLMIGLIAIAAFGALARAQPVFFDDFDGDELLPHWNVPPDDHWGYEVSGGMLNVTGLFYPSDPEDDANYATIGAPFESQTDFRADVWMGWEAGDQPHEIAVYMIGPQGQILARVGYQDSWRGQVIFAVASNQGVFESAPPPGTYHFTIERDGGLFEFFVEGEHFASIPDQFGTSAAGISLSFVGPYPGQFGALHVDQVRVVPSPGALTLVACVGIFSRTRRPGLR